MAGVDGETGEHMGGGGSQDDDVICDLIGHPPPWIVPGGREDRLETS